MRLQISERAAAIEVDAGAASRFARDHWIRLPALLAPSLLDRVRRHLSDAGFVDTWHGAIESHDLRAEPGVASELLVLLCNDPRVLAAVSTLIGDGAISRLNGSIYRLLPDPQYRHAWHDDFTDGRRAAISINVGSGGYEGGTLQLREREGERVLAEVPNTTPGDAVLFRLDPALQHRVTPVTHGAKTAFSGWFRAGTPLLDELRRHAGSSRRP